MKNTSFIANIIAQTAQTEEEYNHDMMMLDLQIISDKLNTILTESTEALKKIKTSMKNINAGQI